MLNRTLLIAILSLQGLCAAYFSSDIVASVLGIALRPIDWVFVELLEIGAVVGLIGGLVISALALRAALRRTEKAEESLRTARMAFREVLDERFAEWCLTPAESEVAMFIVKGFDAQEVASLRGVSHGTIKAQTNAIYRKAGVSGRPQLLSLFIDELVQD